MIQRSGESVKGDSRLFAKKRESGGGLDML